MCVYLDTHLRQQNLLSPLCSPSTENCEGPCPYGLLSLVGKTHLQANKLQSIFFFFWWIQEEICVQGRGVVERKECSPELGRCQGSRTIIMGLPNARGTTSVTCHLSQRFITCNSEDSCYDRITVLLQAGVRPQLQAHHTVMFSLSSPIFLSLRQSSGAQPSKGDQRPGPPWSSRWARIQGQEARRQLGSRPLARLHPSRARQRMAATDATCGLTRRPGR